MKKTNGHKNALSDIACISTLLLLSLFIRIPLFVNYLDFNSDHAVVGLQAKHIVQGEWSFFLWATDYQASFEPLLTAIVNFVVRSLPASMVITSFVAYFICVLCIFLILRKRIGAFGSFISCLPIVFSPLAVHSQPFYPPRFWAFATAFLSLLLIDLARPDEKRPILLFSAGSRTNTFRLLPTMCIL